MFKFLKKKRKNDSDFIYDQCVIVEIDFESENELGSATEHDSVQALESGITEVLPPSSGIDGHDFGESTCTIYIYGPSADSVFKHIESVLQRFEFPSITITLQYGLPDNPSTKEKRFSL